jgi:nucleoside-diphosphate-sugar epimerase
VWRFFFLWDVGVTIIVMQHTHILVTGANGFIGRALMSHFKQLKQGDYTVTACARNALNSNSYACDLTDSDAVITMINDIKPDVIVDCSGVTPHQGANDFSANPVMINNLLHATQQSNQSISLIYMSSVSVYGRPLCSDGFVYEDDILDPQNSYAQSKTVCERIVQNQNDLSYIIMRVANIVGKDAFINHVLNSKTATLRGEKTFQRDIIGVHDICRMVEMAIVPVQKNMQDTINCGVGIGYKFTDIINEIEAQMSNKISITTQPSLNSDIPVLICNRQKAHDVLGWAPTQTDLSKLIHEAIVIHEDSNQ